MTKSEPQQDSEVKNFNDPVSMKQEIKVDSGIVHCQFNWNLYKNRIEKIKEIVTEQELQKESEEIVKSSSLKEVIEAAEDTTVTTLA